MHRPPHRRLPYLILAYACIALGIAGVVLPVVPTTPFLLVAAWAAPKASPRLDAWLYGHPRFGPALVAWREQRAIPPRAKWMACVMLLVSWLIMFGAAPSPWVPIATGALFVAVGTYICTRPSPRTGMERDEA